MSDQGDGDVEIPVIWVGAEDAPARVANQFVSQFERGQFFLTIGQLSPPIILGTPERRQQQVERLGYVPIKVLGKFGMTPAGLQALTRILNENLDQYRLMFGDEGLEP